MSSIRKEVSKLLKENYPFSSIRQKLKAKGYSERIINSAIENNMNKRHPAITTLIALVIIAAIAVAIIITVQELPSRKLIVVNDGVANVNIEGYTKGKGSINFANIEYSDEDKTHNFFIEAYYFNNYFNRKYIANENMKIQITPNLDPDDGIVQVMLFETYENEEPFVYIIVDEDWKNKIKGTTSIFYGKEYSQKAQFDFTQEVSRGIYVNKVKDYEDRFTSAIITDRIILTNFTSLDLESPEKGLMISLV